MDTVVKNDVMWFAFHQHESGRTEFMYQNCLKYALLAALVFKAGLTPRCCE